MTVIYTIKSHHLRHFQRENTFYKRNFKAIFAYYLIKSFRYQIPWYYVNDRCKVDIIDHACLGRSLGFPEPPQIEKGETYLHSTVITAPATYMPRIDVSGNSSIGFRACPNLGATTSGLNIATYGKIVPKKRFMHSSHVSHNTFLKYWHVFN